MDNIGTTLNMNTNSKYSDLKYKYENLEKRNNQLIESVTNFEQTFETELTVRNKKISILQYEISNLEHNNTEIVGENEKLNEDNEKLKVLLEEYKIKIDEQKNAIDSLVTSNDSLNNVIEKYTENDKKYWAISIPRMF